MINSQDILINKDYHIGGQFNLNKRKMWIDRPSLMKKGKATLQTALKRAKIFNTERTL